MFEFSIILTCPHDFRHFGENERSYLGRRHNARRSREQEHEPRHILALLYQHLQGGRATILVTVGHNHSESSFWCLRSKLGRLVTTVATCRTTSSSTRSMIYGALVKQVVLSWHDEVVPSWRDVLHRE